MNSPVAPESMRELRDLIYAVSVVSTSTFNWRDFRLSSDMTHIRTLQCTEPYDSRNGHTVKCIGFPGPLKPTNKRLLYWELHTVLKDTDSRNASGASEIVVRCLVGCSALVAGKTQGWHMWSTGIPSALAWVVG